MKQLKLTFQHDRHFIRSFLERETRKKILLFITDNSSTMLSMKEEKNCVSLRLNRVFLSAEQEVLDEIIRFIKNTKKKTPLIRRFIDQNGQNLKKKSPRTMKVQTQGRYYDLLEIYKKINREYFNGQVSASITWGTKGTRRFAQKRTLGSYSSQNHMIRIHPLLDSRRVPLYFLEFIVYHEMLHADMGIKKNGVRCSAHFGVFRNRERVFKHYERALTWEKKRL
jgi:predicted metal-dependent hydrolase